jgi:S-adenosylmethionine hydrolase
VTPPVVTLLTDYGEGSEFAGVCRGVIQRICPGTTVIDITHGIARHAVREGALVLRNALPYMPAGVHVAVVDPQVGTERRAVAIRCGDGRVLVGPDNGVLSLAAEDSGGALEAIDISRSPHRLEPVSATFHGRDLFAPVAARLALETPIESAGSPVPPEIVARLEMPRATVRGRDIAALVLAVDRFGNLQLNVNGDQLREAGFSQGEVVAVQVGHERRRATLARTFGDVPIGEAVLFEDSSRAIALALNGGSAAESLSAAPDVEVALKPWEE